MKWNYINLNGKNGLWFTRVGWKVYRLKSLYDEIISVVDDFFERWDPNTATPMEKVRGLHEGNCTIFA